LKLFDGKRKKLTFLLFHALVAQQRVQAGLAPTEVLE
jgi:hypothetical protein